MFIPKREHSIIHPTTSSYCKWCGKRQLRKRMFKLVHGPVNFYFCNDEHAIEWCDHRHSCVTVNAVLRMHPTRRGRVLGNLTIAEYVTQQLNLSRQQDENDADAGASRATDGVRNLLSDQVSVSQDA